MWTKSKNYTPSLKFFLTILVVLEHEKKLSFCSILFEEIIFPLALVETGDQLNKATANKEIVSNRGRHRRLDRASLSSSFCYDQKNLRMKLKIRLEGDQKGIKYELCL